MEHAKKLVLIDPSMLPAKQDLVNPRSKLDEELWSTLNSSMADDVKAKMYASILKKHRVFDENAEQKMMNRTNAEDLETQVVQSIPLGNQYKARRLWRYIKNDDDVEWSDKGELIYRKSLIPNSHAIDIVTDLLSRSSASSPPGSSEFIQSLKNNNVPNTLITNSRRLEDQKESESEDNDRVTTPPPRKRFSHLPSIKTRKFRKVKRLSKSWLTY